jgi:hypothetical protein
MSESLLDFSHASPVKKLALAVGLLTLFAILLIVAVIVMSTLFATTPPGGCQGTRCDDGKCCENGCQCFNGACTCIQSCRNGETSCTFNLNSGCCPPNKVCSTISAECCDTPTGGNCVGYQS